MSTFDAEVFSHSVLYDANNMIDTANRDDSVQARVELTELRQDIEATIAAIEVERDGRRAKALRDDLERFLPARNGAIVSAAPSEIRADLEKALALAMRSTMIVARSFVTNGGI